MARPLRYRIWKSLLPYNSPCQWAGKNLFWKGRLWKIQDLSKRSRRRKYM